MFQTKETKTQHICIIIRGFATKTKSFIHKPQNVQITLILASSNRYYYFKKKTQHTQYNYLFFNNGNDRKEEKKKVCYEENIIEKR